MEPARVHVDARKFHRIRTSAFRRGPYMNPDAVQHERAPRSISKGKGSFTGARKSLEGRRERRKKSISKVKYEKEQLSSEPNSPYSSPISPEQWNELESSADIVFSNFDSHSKKDEDEPHLSCNDTTNGDSKLISDVLDVTSEKLPNFGFCSEQSVHSELCPPTSFSLYDSSIQLLYMSVSWARNIPMFMDLPFRDQAILLEEAWSELFLLNAVHYFLPVDLTTLISATDLSPSQSSTSKLVKEIRTLQNVVARFHQLQINAVEYACLKAVVLFKSDLRGLRAPHDIEKLQDQAQIILNDYCQTHVKSPDNARFGKLLLTLPLLRSVNPKMIEQVFFRRDGEVISIEKILCDMFKAC
ncbi:photoreceptor-specific nuclear receptor-like [Paramuricea clavata]|uniref:Photoreceptor-specific nuclear receptor-like n=1 Tax=Paramuricea clavata TaxID=317549 RepID=A0A6S7H7H0_PARCT|nr:photoreceptor-specific nuclear receptor-like [Paramuricea clavata]